MGRVATTSPTRWWEGLRRVSEEYLSQLFILSHLSSARLRKSQVMAILTLLEATHPFCYNLSQGSLCPQVPVNATGGSVQGL